MTATGSAMPAPARRGALLFSLVVLAALAYAAYEVNTGFSTRARLFANVVVVPALALGALQAIREARRVLPPLAPPEAAVTRSALLWAVAFFVSVWAIGLQMAIPVFVLVYLRFGAGEAWPKVAVYAAAAYLFVDILFTRVLHIPLPAGAIALPAITP